MAGDPGLTRCHSLPVLKTEEQVLKRLQDQDGLISLLQTQVEFQSELIAKHDKIYTDLLNKVEELSSKVKTLEESFSKGKEEAARSALWTSTSSGPATTSKDLAEMVKETAEEALGISSNVGGDNTSTGFVFDEKLGLYFDQNSGYYYDPVKQLYYNGHTKTFYSYDATSNTYHEVPSKKNSSKNGGKRKKKTVRSSRCKKIGSVVEVETDPDPLPQGEAGEGGSNGSLSNPPSPSNIPPKPLSDMEEGEISSSQPTSAESSPRGENDSLEESEEEEPASYPPCIRAIVQESVGVIKKGTLFLVPYTGGTIGSDGGHHSILLEESTVEKEHAKFHYEDPPGEGELEHLTSGAYFITDLGSTHGTILNRLPLEPHVPQEVVHGSSLQIGEVTLLLHIHPGDFTCGHCEPGLLLQKEPLYEYNPSTIGGEKARRSEIKKLKKKYGLDRKSEGVPLPPEGGGGGGNDHSKYVDRAKNRRIKIGSDNPFAKTEVASTATPIRETNKGFKMLQKMGWKGEGLGKTENQGITQPIDSHGKTDRLGLGLDSSTTPIPPQPSIPSKKSLQRRQNLAKTLERFNSAQQPPK